MEYKLTKAQTEVLVKLVEGKTTAEIAQEQKVSENTVNTHIKAIYRQMAVHSRAQVVRKAINDKIIVLNP